MGFGTHPHDNMEIISIPLKGALAHKDSTGNEHVINTGDVQIMSAGAVISSEYNASKTDEVNFLQIWVFPKERDIEPRYEQKAFDANDRKNKIQTVNHLKRDGSGKNDGTLWINQDSYFSLANLDKGTDVTYNIKHKGNGVYIFYLKAPLKRQAKSLIDATQWCRGNWFS